MQLPPSSNQRNDPGDFEISLVDILCFLKGAYKTIAITGVIGLAAALAYLAITPKRYEAVAQIAMAQIDAANNNNLSPLGVNIEEPLALMTRLAQPTSFSSEVLSACNVAHAVDPGAILAKSIKLTQPKGVSNVVELRTIAASPQDAKACSKAIFELIKVTQAQIVAPYIDEARIKLADDEARLEKSKNFIAKADKSGQAMGASYLSTRDEIRFLLDEMTALKSLIMSNQSRATRLIAPIYASDTPVDPKKRMVLAFGLLGGLLLGLLLALARQTIARLRYGLGGSKR